MPQTHRLSVASILVGLSIACTACAQTPSPNAQWLLQTVQITGDIREGLRKNCLIVYPTGEYHRERRRQDSTSGRAQFEWEPTEVFAGTLTQDEVNALHAILDDAQFSSIRGAIGDARVPELSYGPHGAVTAHGEVEIVSVAVARPNGPQIFEIADMDVARGQQPLAALLGWVKGTEHAQAQRSATSEANNCSPRTATGNALATTMGIGATVPKAVYTPAPHRPHDAPMPRPIAVELQVNPDGTVSVRSLEGHPNPDIAQSVIDTVSKWKFEPARLLGVPIATTAHLTIKFQDK